MQIPNKSQSRARPHWATPRLQGLARVPRGFSEIQKNLYEDGAAVPAATCTPGNAEAIDVIGDNKKEARQGAPECKQSTTAPGATQAREEEVDNQVDKELEEVHKQVEGPEEAPW